MSRERIDKVLREQFPNCPQLQRDYAARALIAALTPHPVRVKTDPDGTLDDFAAWGVSTVHFEALDESQWYASVVLANGDLWQLNFGAVNARAKGYARAELTDRAVVGRVRADDERNEQ